MTPDLTLCNHMLEVTIMNPARVAQATQKTRTSLKFRTAYSDESI